MQNMNMIGVQSAIEMQADRVNYLFLYLILNNKLNVEVKANPANAQMATYVRAHLFNVKEDNTCSFDLQVLGHAGYPGGENGERLLSTIVSMDFQVLTFLMASLTNEIDELIESRP